MTVSARVGQESGKEWVPGWGSHEPDMNRLEVGPGYDLLASGVRCVELDRNT